VNMPLRPISSGGGCSEVGLSPPNEVMKSGFGQEFGLVSKVCLDALYVHGGAPGTGVAPNGAADWIVDELIDKSRKCSRHHLAPTRNVPAPSC